MRQLTPVLFAARSAVYRKLSFTLPVVAVVGSLFLGATRYANADIINVPGDQPTIQAGIDAALNGDEVVIADGTYTGAGNINLNFNGKLITVRSASGDPTLCIIDGALANGGFTFNSGETNAAVVDGLTITACQFGPPSVGAAFLIQSSSPTINNCILSNNFTGMDGGAIYCDDASPTITNCAFIGNFAIGSGGAIYNSNTSTPQISDCTFEDNTAIGDGGAIYNNTSSPGINNCTFTNNNADDGGAIYNHDSTYAISNCTFTNNDADNGGAIYNITSNGMNCDAIIANCTFTGNSADFDGGGIFNAALCPTVTNCTFNENTAQTRGGAIFVQTGLATITGCVFTGNTALTDVGGGVAIIAPNDHTIEGCLFESNSAALAGGGIDYSPVEAKGTNSLTVCNTNFAGNFTSPEFLGVGGAISNTKGALDLENCTLDSNTATSAGGGIYNAGGSLTLTLCVLGGNFAADNGGGIASQLGTVSTTNCTFSGNAASANGGGMYNLNLTDLTVIDCAFSGNTVAAGGGGGMFNDGGDALISNCTFNDNSAAGAFPLGSGGGMVNLSNTPLIENCNFDGNTADDRGGAMYVDLGADVDIIGCTFTQSTAWRGGAIDVLNAVVTVADSYFEGNFCDPGDGAAIRTVNGDLYAYRSTFFDNHADFRGGAISLTGNVGGQTYEIIDCRFFSNRSDDSGGAVSVWDTVSNTTTVANCIFSGNIALNDAGGLFALNQVDLTVANCTFTNNTAASGGGINTFFLDPDVEIVNCVLWDNSPDEIVGTPTTIVRYCDVEGGVAGGVTDGGGNIDADPLFVDADGADNTIGTEDDDLRLSPGSPCIDAADNTAVPLGITEDLDGNPRFVDDPDTPDTGNGVPPIVDMGAYEFQPVLCLADFDNSGDVGVKDLLFLLGAWGPCPPKGDCPADFDDTGDVGVKDLLFLLGAWGPCP